MKNNILYFATLIIFIIALLASLSKNPSYLPLSGEGEISNPPDKGDSGGYSNFNYVKIAGQKIKVELADTPAEQEQGLSARTVLAEDEGMLFIFERSGIYPFWMKDMKFAIDIIWLAPSEGGDGKVMKVIYIKKDAKPEDYPQSYNPESEALYVLEVVSGFSDKNNLKVGDKIENFVGP